MIHGKTTLTIALAALLLVGLPATVQAAAPAWQLTVSSQPSNFVPNESLNENELPEYVVTATNIGAAPTAGAFAAVDTLPAGVTQHKTGLETVTLTAENARVGGQGGIVWPGQTVSWLLGVDVGNLAEGTTVTNQVTISGGGATPVSAQSTTPISSDPVPFGFLRDGDRLAINDGDGQPATQAASHPYQMSIDLGFPTEQVADTQTGVLKGTGGGLRDLHLSLPRGLIVNPLATPQRCTEAELLSQAHCPASTQVGIVSVDTTPSGNASYFPASTPFFNMVPPPGVAAQFGFDVANGLFIFIHVSGGVNAGDYSLSSDSRDVLARFFNPVGGVQVQLWGDPSAEAHDHLRGTCLLGTEQDNSDACPVTRRDAPFLTMPSECRGSLSLEAEADSWLEPGVFDGVEVPATDSGGSPTGVSGCNALAFSPSLKARPTTDVADSPSGLEVDLDVPQSESLSTLATAHLRKAVVTLPQGLVLNPSSANGLGSCASAQVGIDPGSGLADGSRPSCPDASRIGSVEVDTPLLDHPVPGSVYVATPFDNPFDSLLAIYVVLDDPQSGVLVKLAGKVEPDPATGQLTATFDNNPQLPFNDFKLDFFGGAHGVLRTPAVCGGYSTTSQLTPWSAPESGAPATPHDDYSIDSGPNGSACPSSAGAVPNSPVFDAGSAGPLAGSYAPFVMHLSRPDGTQQFASLTMTPPPGLLARLAGTPACPDAALAAAAQRSGAAEQANPSCPAASRVGTVQIGAGAGPSPYYVQGTAYLAGPYKGAPLSLAIVTPALAGPYDLGTVVVRAALRLDPTSAQVTATSDPIPQILQGIPLDVRSISLSLDKPEFTLNGTSCNPSAVTGQLTGSLGQLAQLSSRFQLAECSNLGFKPKLGLRLRGKTRRSGNPALQAVLQMPAGGANIARTSVALPHSEFLDQGHIRTICTRVQFAANQCPAGSVYGHVVATSPLVDYPLEGPVYLRANGGERELPDLVMKLSGPAYQPVEIDVVGYIDTFKGGIRTTFESVPDAPVSKLVLDMQGGKKGLLENSTNICRSANRATVLMDGQNGKTSDSEPLLKASCGKGGKHRRR